MNGAVYGVRGRKYTGRRKNAKAMIGKGKGGQNKQEGHEAEERRIRRERGRARGMGRETTRDINESARDRQGGQERYEREKGENREAERAMGSRK